MHFGAPLGHFGAFCGSGAFLWSDIFVREMLKELFLLFAFFSGTSRTTCASVSAPNGSNPFMVTFRAKPPNFFA